LLTAFKAHDGSGSWRRAVAALLAVACVAVGAVMAAPRADAAPCSGASCDGLDPDSTGCNELGKVFSLFTRFEEHSIGAWRYELRRSGGCRAVWARFVRDDCEYGSMFPPSYYWIRVQTQISTPATGWIAYRTHTDGMENETDPCTDSTGWTVMAPGHAGTRGRVCWVVKLLDSTPPSSWADATCSGWYLGGG
jgi:hypothetical protein